MVMASSNKESTAENQGKDDRDSRTQPVHVLRLAELCSMEQHRALPVTLPGSCDVTPVMNRPVQLRCPRIVYTFYDAFVMMWLKGL